MHVLPELVELYRITLWLELMEFMTVTITEMLSAKFGSQSYGLLISRACLLIRQSVQLLHISKRTICSPHFEKYFEKLMGISCLVPLGG